MKVGILTFPNSTSYGATLQMYALYHTVKNLGHDTEVINYYSKFMKAEKHCRPKGSSGLRYFLRRLIRRALHARAYAAFSVFEKVNMNKYPDKFFTDKSRLPYVGAKYDAVICGSDQVWNPDITDSDLSYFLDFCGDSTKRISYAPSFGVDVLPMEFAARAGEELRHFSSISVREEQGQALVTGLIGKNAPIVIDPTMLLDAAQWQQLEDDSFCVDEDYVLYYTVKSSPRLFAKCRAFAQKHGLKMVVIGGNCMRKERDPIVRHAVDISPSAWLWLVRHARYVVTNSFHGTAFSIIFEKDFCLELSASTNSRLTNIVKILGLEERILPFEQEIIPCSANYNIAKANLSYLRAASLDYLQKALCEDDVHG